MEFIAAEQFKGQPREIQEVFLDWWKPSIGDIYCNEFLLNFDGDRIQKLEVVTNMTDVDYIKDVSEFLCVLFTEGQLRKFIEEKTEGILVASCNVIGNRLINIVKKDEILGGVKTIRRTHFGEGIDLLEAYWKVACMIAKEEVDGQRTI